MLHNGCFVLYTNNSQHYVNTHPAYIPQMHKKESSQITLSEFKLNILFQSNLYDFLLNFGMELSFP